jgi:hypothetical protein
VARVSLRVGLACVLTVACGGEAKRNPTPLHDGNGFYELVIESRSDDCKPPLVVGDLGEVLLPVRAPRADGSGGGTNIPLPFGPPPYSSHTDIQFDDPIELMLAPPFCSVTTDDLRLDVLSANGDGMDITMLWTRSGSAACPADQQLIDCSSNRILHFRWIRRCTGDLVIKEGDFEPTCCQQ